MSLGGAAETLTAEEESSRRHRLTSVQTVGAGATRGPTDSCREALDSRGRRRSVSGGEDLTTSEHYLLQSNFSPGLVEFFSNYVSIVSLIFQ